MDGTWIETGNRVLARRYAELDLTVGLVIGTERALVVDTRGDARQGAELAAAVRTMTVTRTVSFCPGTPRIAPRRLTVPRDGLREAVWSPASIRRSSTSSFALLPTQLAGVLRCSVWPGARWLLGSVGTRRAQRTAPGLVVAPDLCAQTVPERPALTRFGEQFVTPGPAGPARRRTGRGCARCARPVRPHHVSLSGEAMTTVSVPQRCATCSTAWSTSPIRCCSSGSARAARTGSTSLTTPRGSRSTQRARAVGHEYLPRRGRPTWPVPGPAPGSP